MPLRKAVWTGSGYQVLRGKDKGTVTVPPEEPPVFTPGVTQPYYFPASDLTTAQKNVGNLPGVTLTNYTGTVTNGIISLSDGATYTNKIFTGVVEARNSERFLNCRFIVPKTYTSADSIKACIRTVNGASNNQPYFEDCEIHNRAQRPLNGFSGRNTTLRRSVVTGCIDGWATSSVGSAGLLFGYDIADCVVPDLAWWYSSTVNSDNHPSDKESHSDGIQHGDAGLRSDLFNTTIGAYVSEIIGTGTPGSGSDAGNTYVPSSGYNFISTQSQMESWRASYASTFSTPAQSMFGVAHRLVNLNVAGQGSQAAIMINRENFYADKCYIGGGTVAINALDTNLPTNMNVAITNTKFWNDMRSDKNRASTVKGQALIMESGKSLTWSGNTWFDGTNTNITYI